MVAFVGLQPEPLVRLVPDQPVANPRVAAGRCGREAAEVSWPRRRVVRRAPAVRPRRRPDEREHGRQAVAAKPAQDPVRPAPVVGAIARRGRILRPSRRDLVPAQREADERHAESLERPQALVERLPGRTPATRRPGFRTGRPTTPDRSSLPTQAASARSSTNSVIRPVVVLIGGSNLTPGAAERVRRTGLRACPRSPPGRARRAPAGRVNRP